MQAFEKKVWLSSPTMHGDELKYMIEAYETNWMSTVGKNINELERIAAARSGAAYAVGLTNGTAALHLCIKEAGERLYGKPAVGHGALEGRQVFCTDLTFAATLNPVVYEGGIPVFIDTEPDSWNMDPDALERAFACYPDVRLVIYAELYGFPGKLDRIKAVCEQYGAILIEDAAEALGATLNGKHCGSFGDLGALSYNGNKIITGSAGGCLLTDDPAVANRVRKWSTQAREATAWYQHEEVGYNYRISNVVAGVIRGQYPYLEEHIARKRAIYEGYRDGFRDLPVQMNPILPDAEPNYWLSAMVIDRDAMCTQIRDESRARYIPEPGKSCPTQILESLAAYNAEGRPFWKPMHMQPVYRMHAFVSADVTGDVGKDLFARGLCLPSDIKMTRQQQEQIIQIVRDCFGCK